MIRDEAIAYWVDSSDADFEVTLRYPDYKNRFSPYRSLPIR